MKVDRFSDKQIAVLKSLATYKFLTYRQMQRLHIEKHKSNLSVIVSSLRERSTPYVRKIPHRFGIEAKHYLTKKGKEILTELCHLPEEQIQFPKGIIKTDTQDQKHRTSLIDIQIELYDLAKQNGIEVEFCDRYFDVTGSNRVAKSLKSKTAIIYEGKKTLKADMTFMIKMQGNKELYLLELENGVDAQKTIPKCIMHGKAILRGSANERYNYKKGYRTLWVFEHRSTMESVLGKLSGIAFFKELQEYFLFKSLEDIPQDLFGGWVNLSGEQRKMYY